MKRLALPRYFIFLHPATTSAWHHVISEQAFQTEEKCGAGLRNKHKKTTMQKHPTYRLTYALNATGQLVDVDEVPVGNKCGCFCPACKEPLTAKNQGAKRMHHFAHQSGTECDCAVESMLHILAKEKIREAFLSKSEFWIEFEYKSYCTDSRSCRFIHFSECCETKRQRFDIKRFYDSCEQETPYDNINRRSDLKIFSSTHPERNPIYLEFFVTHASDQEKLHSGNKIIEIRIESVDDILRLAENGIVESISRNSDYFHEEEEEFRSVSFYGFKNKDYSNSNISSEIEFDRYILYQSGKSLYHRDRCNCKRLAKSRASSLLEICIHARVSPYDLPERLEFIGYQKFRIPNCRLCQYCADGYDGMGKICRLYKHLQIPRDLDTARAKTCHCFSIDQKKMQSALQDGVKECHTTFCKHRGADDIIP